MSIAQPHVDLGLPIPRDSRLRFIKKLTWRVLAPFLSRQISFNHGILAEVRSLNTRLEAMEARTAADLEGRLARLDGDLNLLSRAITSHEEPLNRFEQAFADHNVILGDLQASREQMRDEIARQLDIARRQLFTRQNEEAGTVRRDFAELLVAFEETKARADLLQRELSAQHARLAELDLFLAAAKRAYPAQPSPAELAALPSGLEGVYDAVHDAFRGSRELIKERCRSYLAEVQAVAGGHGGAVLDIGSGRGEWLELLAEEGVKAYGIDINTTYVDETVALGLDVRKVDAIEHLRGLEHGSLSAVTAFQLVEHLPTDNLIELIDLCLLALEPGGVLILETPNPDNVIVGASTFYLDPTHERPIPSPLLSFFVSARGFVDVEVREQKRTELSKLSVPTTRDPELLRAILPMLDAVNQRFFGPQDYAVVGRRP